MIAFNIITPKQKQAMLETASNHWDELLLSQIASAIKASPKMETTFGLSKQNVRNMELVQRILNDHGWNVEYIQDFRDGNYLRIWPMDKK